jgi:hypothetical protein
MVERGKMNVKTTEELRDGMKVFFKLVILKAHFIK